MRLVFDFFGHHPDGSLRSVARYSLGPPLCYGLPPYGRHHYTSLMRKKESLSWPAGLVILIGFLGVIGSVHAQPNCPGILTPNALPDGDFGSGPPAILPTNPGIAPGYIYQPMPPPQDGYYTIASTTNFGPQSFPCWLITGDNSDDPDGYMMVVNASNEPGIFFRRRVDVCENTSYIFQADILNLMRPTCAGTDPEIDFLIDGDVLFQTGTILKTQVWETYGFTFETGPGVTEIELSLRNNAPGGAGNDFALDNIGFFHCGPNVVISQGGVICEGGALELRADVTEVTYDNIQFQWQVSGDMGASWVNIPGANGVTWTVPAHRGADWYRLLVANSQANLQSLNCRTTTEPFEPEVNEAPMSFEEFSICVGDSIFLFDTLVGTPGVYEFLLQDGAGCDSIVLVDLTEWPVYNDTVSVSFICPGSEWEGIPIFADTFIVQEGVTLVGCDSLTIFDIRLFDSGEVFIHGGMSVCAGEQVELAAVSGFVEYAWSTGESTETISVGPGTYSLSVTDVNGCVTTLTREVLEVDLVAEVSVSDELCPQSEDGRIRIVEVLGGIPPYVYSISGSGVMTDEPFLEDLAPGGYRVTIRDSIGCVFDSLVTVGAASELTSSVVLGGVSGAQFGESISVDIQTNFEFDSIFWASGGEISCVTCPSILWVPSLEGDLSWVIFTAEGCMVTGDTTFVADVSLDVYFPTAFSPNGDQINDLFRPYFRQEGTRIEYFQVYDRWGSMVYEEADVDGDLTSFGWDGTHGGRDLQPGTYIYISRVVFPDGSFANFGGSVVLMR